MATIAHAAALDDNDPLAKYRDAFDLPRGIIYLDGNSLGPPPRAALVALERAAQKEWREDLITSWNETGDRAGWINLPTRTGAKIAKIIGAPTGDVIVTDSVSVNIFKLAAALLAERNGAIAYEAGEFPTDGYILQGLAGLVKAELVAIAENDPAALANNNIGVLIKSAVHYKTAEVADIAAWETAARDAGTDIIWDLSHAAGCIALDLQRDGASFAVGCGYKYLNGGPGAPAFVYAASERADKLRQPLSGWMGHASPFDFAGDYQPAPGVSRFAAGTPPVLSMTALDAALDIFDGVDMRAVEQKAKKLGDLFLESALTLGLSTVSPGVDERRGGHVSLEFDQGYAVVKALIDRGVIGDFRAPNLMRFGFSPLFLSYNDVVSASDTFAEIMNNEKWRAPEYAIRDAVT